MRDFSEYRETINEFMKAAVGIDTSTDVLRADLLKAATELIYLVGVLEGEDLAREWISGSKSERR